MALKQRNQHLALAGELLHVHLPSVLAAGDQPLARDLLRAFAEALGAVRADAEEAAGAWEERDQRAKADAVRREWSWTDFAARYATSLARSSNTLEPLHLERLQWLIPIELPPPARPKIADPQTLRGGRTAKKGSAPRKPGKK